ncbi:MAG: division/cell wall cluster transcriptional repressor MraZ [Candidatus Omnitrophica bacterium]|nr:division/cell wall cluster transcriptional repressor MraZ [Candidatus Omnitrophota bacterium]
MFYGEYSHSLDKKGRMIIPSRFRDTIQEEGIEKLYITRGLDECLFMFSEKEWKAQENKFRAMSFTKKQVREFKRLFFSGAVAAVPDKQWRVLIPDYLREYAHIVRSIRIVGVSDRIEIWDSGKWKEFYRSSRENYEEIAENLLIDIE